MLLSSLIILLNQPLSTSRFHDWYRCLSRRVCARARQLQHCGPIITVPDKFLPIQTTSINAIYASNRSRFRPVTPKVILKHTILTHLQSLASLILITREKTTTTNEIIKVFSLQQLLYYFFWCTRNWKHTTKWFFLKFRRCVQWDSWMSCCFVVVVLYMWNSRRRSK